MLIAKADMMVGDKESKHQNLCTSIVVSESPIYQGEVFRGFNKCSYLNQACATEDYGIVMRFNNIANLQRVENAISLETITNSITCLMAMAHVNSDAEATKLIDLLSEIRIAKKYLTIVIPKLNMTFLQKKTINFNVILRHSKPGNRHS